MVNRISMAASQEIKLLGRKARKKGGGGAVFITGQNLLSIYWPQWYQTNTPDVGWLNLYSVVGSRILLRC